MQRSASLFGASLMQWELSDGISAVVDVWTEESGGRAALVGRIEDVIERERPTLVLTFDPRHGTTCHPAHRGAGELVVEAMAGLGVDTPPLYFLETAVAFESDGFRFSNAMVSSSSSIAFGAGSEWRYLVDVARIHGSQFTNFEVEGLAATPQTQRWVFLASASGSREYAITCP
jgi:LmbE family N-acetylglucosaminyl deacetylase